MRSTIPPRFPFALAAACLLGAAVAVSAQDGAPPPDAPKADEPPPPPPPPLPELMARLGVEGIEDEDVTQWQLYRHGAAAAAPLAEALGTGPAKRRLAAAAALEAIGPHAAGAADALRKIVEWQPAKGDEVAPDVLGSLRTRAWRALARVGTPAAQGAAMDAVKQALKDAARTPGGPVPEWCGAAIGCALALGGEKAQKALGADAARLILAPGSPEPFLKAVGEAREPGLLPVLAAALQVAEQEAQAVAARNKAAREKAEKAKKPAPAEEPIRLATEVIHKIFRDATKISNGTAASWMAWWQKTGPYAYFSARSGKLQIDEEAQTNKKPSVEWRRDHPWPPGEGPFSPPDEPRGAGGAGGAGPMDRREAPDEGGDGELPGQGGEDEKDGE